MGGLFQGGLWGIFLLITLIFPSSITFAWLPFLVAAGAVWPNCLAFYNTQDSATSTTYLTSEQTIIFTFYTESILFTGYELIKHTGKARSYLDEFFIEKDEVVALSDANQVYAEINFNYPL